MIRGARQGVPSWVSSEPYDIEAKAEGNPSSKVLLGAMLQALLEDRFQLKIHRETEKTPVYALTLATGGVKLHQTAEGGCIANFDPAKHPSFFASGEKLPSGLMQDDRNGMKESLDASGISLAWRFRGVLLDHKHLDLRSAPAGCAGSCQPQNATPTGAWYPGGTGPAEQFARAGRGEYNKQPAI
jgi:hypothetical protein